MPRQELKSVAIAGIYNRDKASKLQSTSLTFHNMQEEETCGKILPSKGSSIRGNLFYSSSLERLQLRKSSHLFENLTLGNLDSISAIAWGERGSP